MTVRPAISRSSACSTSASVPGSRFDVASSSTNTAGSTSAARARATSCRSPADNLLPRSLTSVSKPSGNVAKCSVAPIAAMAASISSSVAAERAIRRLSRMVPLNKKPSCGTTTIRSRNDDIVAIFRLIPPYDTLPTCGSYKRAISLARVDFPAPVGPTRASFSPTPTLILTPCNARVSAP